MKFGKQIKVLIVCAVLFISHGAMAFDTYYLENTNAKPDLSKQASLVDQLMLDFVVSQDKEMISLKLPDCSYVLKPKLVRVGKKLVLKIQKTNKHGKVIAVYTEKIHDEGKIQTATTKAMKQAMALHKIR